MNTNRNTSESLSEHYVAIVRKANRPGGRRFITAAKVAAVAEQQKWSRVKREAITALFCSQAFDALPLVTQADIDSPTKRAELIASGAVFIVPVSDLGRVGMATESVTESIRLWIAKNLADVAPAGSYGVLFV